MNYRPLTGEEWLQNSNKIIINPKGVHHEVFAVRLSDMNEPLVILRCVYDYPLVPIIIPSKDLLLWTFYGNGKHCRVELKGAQKPSNQTEAKK